MGVVSLAAEEHPQVRGTRTPLFKAEEEERGGGEGRGERKERASNNRANGGIVGYSAERRGNRGERVEEDGGTPNIRSSGKIHL